MFQDTLIWKNSNVNFCRGFGFSASRINFNLGLAINQSFFSVVSAERSYLQFKIVGKIILKVL